MKKYTLFVLILALLLTCACSKKPVDTPVQDDPPVQQEQPVTPPADPVTTPEVPEASEVPETPAPPVASETPEAPQPPEVPESPVAPEVPEEPQQPAEVEPEGFVSVSVLPGNISGMKGASSILPLNEQVSVVLGEFDDGWQLMAYDYRASVVLSKLPVECYEGAGPLALLETDPYVLLYQDGRYAWKVTVDSNWQMIEEKTDVQALYSQMGGLTVETPESGMTLDGDPIPALQTNDRVSYAFVRVLNDHQLLYYATDRSILSLSHYGVYDHATGETRAVTTMGQQVVGTWGGNLLVGLWAENGWYNLGLIRLEDMSYTELAIGCDTAAQAASGIEFNREGTRVSTVRFEEGGNTVRVYALPEGELLYQWTMPTDAEWTCTLTSEHSILFWKKQSGSLTIWTVEY